MRDREMKAKASRAQGLGREQQASDPGQCGGFRGGRKNGRSVCAEQRAHEFVPMIRMYSTVMVAGNGVVESGDPGQFPPTARFLRREGDGGGELETPQSWHARAVGAALPRQTQSSGAPPHPTCARTENTHTMM